MAKIENMHSDIALEDNDLPLDSLRPWERTSRNSIRHRAAIITQGVTVTLSMSIDVYLHKHTLRWPDY
jgi:hypothetical protein